MNIKENTINLFSHKQSFIAYIREEFQMWQFLRMIKRSTKEIRSGNFSEIQDKDLESVESFLKAL